MNTFNEFSQAKVGTLRRNMQRWMPNNLVPMRKCVYACKDRHLGSKGTNADN